MKGLHSRLTRMERAAPSGAISLPHFAEQHGLPIEEEDSAARYIAFRRSSFADLVCWGHGLPPVDGPEIDADLQAAWGQAFSGGRRYAEHG